MGSWKQLSPSQYHTLDLGVAFGITDVGIVRTANQDNFHISPELGLLAVADGMGGHAGGEIASAEAIEQLCGFIAAARGQGPVLGADGDTTIPVFRASAFDPSSTDPDATWTDATMKAMITLHDAVEFANARLYAANVARHQADGMGMGTTLTGMWQPAPHGPVFIFHVGDSRLYCWRGGALRQLTRDQTLYQQALDLGAPEPLPPRNLLLQALGPTATVRPELLTRAVAPGDVYLLCSDGLYGDSDPAAIAAILADARDDNLDACCAALVDLARRDGGRDNITALLLRCRA
ncbi:PP2C family protein-serine/threonine phosphatase [Pseudoduganella umbonata]|uniref:Protein phosphatase n=1 Tax=Pseudoduganella umbonata TaxID=864828 RepID=A0A7W5E7K3_9BURK|nr:protein phosphatase 2C domain-containing protein [Pseudoduganella umbonata]MBB3219705.1 protein phosphatase [Pseudoduganella umbonata]